MKTVYGWISMLCSNVCHRQQHQHTKYIVEAKKTQVLIAALVYRLRFYSQKKKQWQALRDGWQQKKLHQREQGKYLFRFSNGKKWIHLDAVPNKSLTINLYKHFYFYFLWGAGKGQSGTCHFEIRKNHFALIFPTYLCVLYVWMAEGRIKWIYLYIEC